MIQKDKFIPVFTAALFTIAKHESNLNVHFVIHIYNAHYSAIKKIEIMLFTAT